MQKTLAGQRYQKRHAQAKSFESKKSGWEGEAKEYNSLVGESGHYYHQHLVIPESLKLLSLKAGDALLDLGCGQGVFARALPKNTSYVGVDSARSLIQAATKLDQDPHHLFIEASATRPLKSIRVDFTHALCMLALQNMEYPDHAVKNAGQHLVPGGKFLIVLNHPSFRIPRQSGWGEHPNKIQYRWVNRYMNYLKIPITMHPGARSSAVTMSYHLPLSRYSRMLHDNGFTIELIEEWCSGKESAGKLAKMENRARAEFPLFMAILARKK